MPPPGKTGIAPLDIDPDAEDELQFRGVNVGAAEDEGDVEVIAIEVTESGAVKTGLRFEPNEE